MESINLFDGFVLTIVSMVVVFIVLAAIWGLTELVARFIGKEEAPSTQTAPKPAVQTSAQDTQTLVPNKKHQQVAEVMALILAAEDEPNKKFEIIEAKRIK